jgi:uncharacterized protein
MAAKFGISKDHAGKFRFHLKAPNGEIIAASQGYETKASAEKGIAAIKTHAPSAKVEDHRALLSTLAPRVITTKAGEGRCSHQDSFAQRQGRRPQRNLY